MGLRDTEIEYMPGDVVSVTSALYRVVHDISVRFTTLLYMDNNTYLNLLFPYSTVTDLARFLG